MFAYENVWQFSTHVPAAMLRSASVPPVKVPAGMSGAGLPMAVLVQLICENGIVLGAARQIAGDVTDSTPVPVPVGVRTQPPTYTCAGGLHTTKLS